MSKKKERQDNEKRFFRKVVNIRRVSKKTKGGNRLAFTCLAVVGDGAGRVGSALCHAPDVYSSIQKATQKARRQMIKVNLVGEHQTIPHFTEVKQGAAHVLLKPAPEGTGLIVGGAMRAVAEAVGIKNVVGKNLGTRNKKNVVDATLEALNRLKSPEEKRIKG